MISMNNTFPSIHFDPTITQLKTRITELEKELKENRPHINIPTEELEKKAEWNNGIIEIEEEGLKDPKSWYAQNHYEKYLIKHQAENHEIKLELMRRGINYDYETYKRCTGWKADFYRNEWKWADQCIKYREDDINAMKRYSLGLKEIKINKKYEHGKFVDDVTQDTTGYTYEWGCHPEHWARVTVWIFGRVFKQYFVNDYDEGHLIEQMMSEWKR